MFYTMDQDNRVYQIKLYEDNEDETKLDRVKIDLREYFHPASITEAKTGVNVCIVAPLAPLGYEIAGTKTKKTVDEKYYPFFTGYVIDQISTKYYIYANIIQGGLNLTTTSTYSPFINDPSSGSTTCLLKIENTSDITIRIISAQLSANDTIDTWKFKLSNSNGGLTTTLLENQIIQPHSTIYGIWVGTNRKDISGTGHYTTIKYGGTLYIAFIPTYNNNGTKHTYELKMNQTTITEDKKWSSNLYLEYQGNINGKHFKEIK